MKHDYLLSTVLGLFISVNLPAQSAAPTGLTPQAYDHHVELRWDLSPDPRVAGYRVYAGTDTTDLPFVGFVNNVTTRYVHFVGEWDRTVYYQLRTVDNSGQLSEPSATASATTFEMTDEQLLDMVQEYTFRYFWDFAHPVSGLARERNTTSTVTTGGSGFGIMAIIVGAERGFITYEQALERTTKIVNFLRLADRFRGAFPHWMNGATGRVVPFSQRDNGGDLVETAFLLQGLLTARQYYAGDSPEETALRQRITELWEDVNWNWYRKQVGDVLYWHWSPNYGFEINHAIRGFNETHIVYILGIAAPLAVHRIPASLYHTGWAAGNYKNVGATYYGYPLEVGGFRGGPLFFSHYSYMGFDPRGKADRYTNYFVRNTYHTLINRAHCIANPYQHEGYGSECWGLTASDDPIVGYLAHAPDNPTVDNGTIAPTAALGSMPYTPEFSLEALKYFYRELGDQLWGIYGFYDAFNLDRNWFADSYLAIDQGPIINMIENYRSGLLWDLFMSNPEIEPALDAIGFLPDSTVVVSTHDRADIWQETPRVWPNPAGDYFNLKLHARRAGDLHIRLVDITGRPVQGYRNTQTLPAAATELTLPLPNLPTGLYGLLLELDGRQLILPLYVHQL